MKFKQLQWIHYKTYDNSISYIESEIAIQKGESILSYLICYDILEGKWLIYFGKNEKEPIHKAYTLPESEFYCQTHWENIIKKWLIEDEEKIKDEI